LRRLRRTPACRFSLVDGVGDDDMSGRWYSERDAVYDAAVDLRTAVQDLSRVEGTLIMVDEFLNHRVEPDVIRDVGVSLASWAAPLLPSLVLTAEASGIPAALSCALELDVPLVYAKKFVTSGDRASFVREVASPTKGVEYRVEVSRRVLAPGLRIAIIDDILAQGRTAEALGEIVEEAGGTVVGFGFAMEKAFMTGRQRLEAHGWDVHAVVEVEAINGGSVTLRSVR
jgi:xanthine phosphoribosyltransferase